MALIKSIQIVFYFLNSSIKHNFIRKALQYTIVYNIQYRVYIYSNLSRIWVNQFQNHVHQAALFIMY